MRYAVEYGARGGQGPLVSPVFSSLASWIAIPCALTFA